MEAVEQGSVGLSHCWNNDIHSDRALTLDPPHLRVYTPLVTTVNTNNVTSHTPELTIDTVLPSKHVIRQTIARVIYLRKQFLLLSLNQATWKRLDRSKIQRHCRELPSSFHVRGRDIQSSFFFFLQFSISSIIHQVLTKKIINVTMLEYLILFLYFFLSFGSDWKHISNTNGVSNHIEKHLVDGKQYSATSHGIFKFLLGVWKCYRTRHFVFDIWLQ